MKDRLEKVETQDYDEQDAIYSWRQSQSAWHRKQAHDLPDGSVRRWHRKQARIYSNGVSFSFMMAKAFRKYGPLLASSIQQNNTLLTRLMEVKHANQKSA